MRTHTNSGFKSLKLLPNQCGKEATLSSDSVSGHCRLIRLSVLALSGTYFVYVFFFLLKETFNWPTGSHFMPEF
jgi:hypothetical protein